MVTYWRSWAQNLTHKEADEINKMSFGFAWLNFNKHTGGWEGQFYYFPRRSGYKDSPDIPKELMKKVELKDLERGWLIEEEPKGSCPLETVADVFPEEMDKLYERFQAKISEEHIR